MIITSSTQSEPIKEDIFDYKRDTYWLSDGNGIDEWINFKIVFTHNPNASYTIPVIGIINGDATNDQAWKKYSRAKTIGVYINDKLIYTLNLGDTIQYQIFKLPFNIGFNNNIPFDLKFEIIDVSPGEREQVAISEIYLDPSIPH